MPPTSGELWGQHFMPASLLVDCLVPNGLLIVVQCARDATLEKIKNDLWQLAKKRPLFSLLEDKSFYVFDSVTSDGEREEFYDETRRLCDLRLFQPFLKLTESRGNKEEMILASDISVALGVGVHELDSQRDLEVLLFRGCLTEVCQGVVERRDRKGKETLAIYNFPPDITASPDLPPHLKEKTANRNLLICIWVVTSDSRNKYTIRVAPWSTVSEVIAETVRYRLGKLNKTAEEQQRYLQQFKDSYVLKQCGCSKYFLRNCLITQYKYIRHCLSRDRIPQLMLLSKASLLENIPTRPFIMPSYATRGKGALETINRQPALNLWSIESMFQIQIKCATYVSVRDQGKLFVRAGLYHGVETLCPQLNTRQVDCLNPRWNEWLSFDLFIPDTPRCARLCLALCMHKRRGDVALGWGNVNVFDFNDHLRTGKLSVALWPVPQGMEELLNPIGTPGSNPSPECTCLEIELQGFSKGVIYPNNHQLDELAVWAESRKNHSRSNSISSTRPLLQSQLSRDEESIDEQLQDILRKDPLCDMTEQENEFLWENHHRLKTNPAYRDILPKVVNAVKWSSREDVAVLYSILPSWSAVSVEAALQLLYCRCPDSKVREFAVQCLEQVLTDDQLSSYLLQLVQVLKFEPYYDNALTRFLLQRALLNQHIGHFFFWHLKSEMHQDSIKLRFALILEAYCRGSDAYLKCIIRQVEAVDKLTKLTEELKLHNSEERQYHLMKEHVQKPDYLESLQNLPSPLDSAQELGTLIISKCQIMSSKKKPLWLTWTNPDPMSQVVNQNVAIIFKNGDDLRQDMLTIQILSIMDSIWQSEGLDLEMIPYGCLATGPNSGLIEVVQNSKTIMKVLENTVSGGIGLNNKILHKWILNCNKTRYEDAIASFTRSCAGYCVASFVLGIRDRHPDNIMVTESGQVFHIDFGHFLNHRKKKFGINRERVPFVLTFDFIRVIAKGKDSLEKSDEFKEFQKLCMRAYLALRAHANVFITLLVMMLSCGIPELESMDDIGYVRKTLQVDKSEEVAKKYFEEQMYEAYNNSKATKIDWFAHKMNKK